MPRPPKEYPIAFCEECGDAFKRKRRNQRFCANRVTRCRWRKWSRDHRRVIVPKVDKVETAVSAVEQPATVNIGRALAAIRWQKEREGTVKSRKRKAIADKE